MSEANPTAKPKRVRRDPHTTRGLILETAERLMIAEGYAAVSTRRVAQDIGLNAATVHYYYPTTDDLFVALLKGMTNRHLDNLEAALKSNNPLQAFWQFQLSWDQSELGLELIALSNHRKSIRPELTAVTEQARAIHTQALERTLAAAGMDTSHISAVALTTLLVVIARGLANEERVGIALGHKEAREMVGSALKLLLRQPKSG